MTSAESLKKRWAQYLPTQVDIRTLKVREWSEQWHTSGGRDRTTGEWQLGDSGGGCFRVENKQVAVWQGHVLPDITLLTSVSSRRAKAFIPANVDLLPTWELYCRLIAARAAASILEDNITAQNGFQARLGETEWIVEFRTDGRCLVQLETNEGNLSVEFTDFHEVWSFLRECGDLWWLEDAGRFAARVTTWAEAQQRVEFIQSLRHLAQADFGDDVGELTDDELIAMYQ